MAINERASSDARHARTGKDAGLYDGDGTLLASMETFASKATYNLSLIHIFQSERQCSSELRVQRITRREEAY